MMNRILSAALSVAALWASADERLVSLKSVSQDPSSRVVTVKYALGTAPAIVTMTVETNAECWTAIDGSALRNISGDIGRIFRETSDELTVKWYPTASWPDHAFESGQARVVIKAWRLDDPPQYALFNLITTNDVSFYESEEQLPYKITDGIFKTDILVMRRIPAANVTWRMGAMDKELGRNGWEMPHYVKLSSDYYMGVFELTQRQFARIWRGSYESKSSKYQNQPKSPAVGLQWVDLRGSGEDYDFPGKGHAVSPESLLGLLRSHTGQDFDLPTEAQWEYAARAGVGGPFQDGINYWDEEVYQLGWFKDHSSNTVHEVGLCRPNAWGLYDVHGNAGEWCLDWISYDITMYKLDPEGPRESPADADSVASSMNGSRVVRSCSIGELIVNARLARRGWGNPERSNEINGARLCLPVVLK
jgi:formylglycine-generating enzyme required for sulfatase activity